MKYLGFKSVLNEYKQTCVKASKLCQLSCNRKVNIYLHVKMRLNSHKK